LREQGLRRPVLRGGGRFLQRGRAFLHGEDCIIFGKSFDKSQRSRN
jgi:hypothetical protein